MVKPLIIMPLAGAMVGLFFYLVDSLFNRRGWTKDVIYAVSLVGFVIALWLGIVLGLTGTKWN